MNRTPRLQRALDFAKDTAARHGHSSVTSTHLVRGLLALGSGIPFSVLQRAGVWPEDVDRVLARDAPASEAASAPAGVPFNSSSLLALKQAEGEAARFQHTILGCDHLFLALLADTQNEAAELFAAAGIDPARMREQIVLQLGQ